MNKNDIRDLYIHAFRGTSPDVTKYSVGDVKETLRAELQTLAPNKYEYERNKQTIFQIIQEAFDEILPQYVGNFVSQFAEVKQVPNGQKARFKVKRGRKRAKTFVTEVGLAGVYEAFRLDVDYIDVTAKAYGGAAYVDFERMLCGDEDMTEPLQLLLEGLEEKIYQEMLKALVAATGINGDMPAANYVTANNFNPAEMQRLCTIAKSYGGGSAIIFATPEFVQAMGPDAIGMPVYGTTPTTPGATPGYATPVYSPYDIDSIAKTGFITMFRGTPIVQLPQNFVDDDNEVYQVPPEYAFIFPAGDQKIVKVVFEGETDVRDWQHRDRQMEIEIYKKFGIAVLTTNNWCVYENTSLKSYTYINKNGTTTTVNPSSNFTLANVVNPHNGVIV